MKSRTTPAKKQPRHRQHRSHNKTGPKNVESAGHPAPRRWLPTWLIALVCMMLVGIITYAVFHYVILTRVPHAMVGKWLVVGKEMKGATLEFTRQGAMIGTVNMEGTEGKIKGRVKVSGKTMWITTINPITNEPHTDVQTIRTLSANQFIIEDRKGTVLKMEPLRE